MLINGKNWSPLLIRASTRMGKIQGAIATVLIASLIIFVLFSNHILEANQVSFASGGDGLKSTFSTLYHIEYDSSYWHFEGMNYPFGESVFFTGNQTFLTNAIKNLPLIQPENENLDLELQQPLYNPH